MFWEKIERAARLTEKTSEKSDGVYLAGKLFGNPITFKKNNSCID
jgi:hypothetical protein